MSMSFPFDQPTLSPSSRYRLPLLAPESHRISVLWIGFITGIKHRLAAGHDDGGALKSFGSRSYVVT
jgi:hypothetical protein